MIDRRAMLAAAGAFVAAAPAWPTRARPGATPAGRPDLTGTWTNATYTDLERPDELTRLALTPAEAEAFEKPRRALHGMPASKEAQVGQNESEFNDRGAGLLRLGGEIRSSLIVDPPNGKIPYLKWVRAKLQLDLKPAQRTQRLDNPEDRPLPERCLLSPSSAPPLVPGPDTNVFQFVQTRDALAILSEKYHDTRIIRFGGEAEAHPLPSWQGASVGRWVGPMLVVETTGLGPGLVDRTPVVSGATQVTECFTRTGPGEILYQFTVEDPTVYSRPWRAEMVFTPSAGPVFEYACHEGNYGLPDILLAARRAEAAGGGK